MTGLRLGVLGPLVLEVDGAPVAVPGTKRRAVLAMLAMAAPDSIGADRLVDAVWPDDPPESGRAALQSHLSRIRRHLGARADRLTRTEAGYRLALAPGELDAKVLGDALRDARRVAPDDPVTARHLLETARAQWRDAPLPELTEVAPLAAWGRALSETYVAACELQAELSMSAGEPDAALAAARDALVVEPLRESAVHLRMRALAAQGRLAEALREAHGFRGRLVEVTGLDPSPALARLESELSTDEPAVAVASEIPAAGIVAPVDTLIGRERELAGVSRLLAGERLVTVVGPGGVGKTRLALAAAERAGAGSAAVVRLASVTDPTALGDVVARALGIDRGRDEPIERVVRHLRHRPCLLVIDNCEHLLGEVRQLVATLVERCPDLTVLATSRIRLGLAVEQTTRLAPLPMPAPQADDIEDVPSVALFIDRARRARPELALDSASIRTIGRIVRALEGMPLAIELAAGRASSLALIDLERRLDRALDVLGQPVGADPEERHRSLRAAVRWSYDLLGHDEQRLFRHLAVFAGGFDLDTAEGVAADLGLGGDATGTILHLVDSSVLVAELDGEPRYGMLDTLRRFGLDVLDELGETEQATDRFLRWAVDLAAGIDAAYGGGEEGAADRRLRAELPNLRAAWRIALDAGDLERAASIVVDLYQFAIWRHITELTRLATELAGVPALAGHPREAQVLGVAAEMAWTGAGDLRRAEELARRAVAAVRPGDELGYAIAHWALADVDLFAGRFAEAASRAIDASVGTTWAVQGSAQAALASTYAGDLETARSHLAEAQRLARGPTITAYLHYIAGEIANASEEWRTAIGHYEDAVELARSVQSSFIAGVALVGLVTAQASIGDDAQALDGYRELIDRWERSSAWTQQWTTLRNLADLLDRLGEEASAEQLRAAADAAPEAAAVPDRPASPSTDGTPPLGRDEALALAREAIDRARSTLVVR
jgi:predicted ATPase/DNA-binding SARP family transcriptional activator